MGVLKIRKETEEKPEWELDNNRLTIRTKTEGAFLADFAEMFWKLMHSEQKVVVLDIARCVGLADDAFRMIALQMFEIGNRGKEVIIRIPEVLQTYFRHSKLYRVAEIECVKLVGEKEKTGDAKEALEGAVAQIAKDIQQDAGEQGAEVPDVSIDKSSLAQMLKNRFAQQIQAQKEEDAKKALEKPGEIRTGKGRLIDRRTGQIVEINKNPTMIGRVPGNDILIAIPLVSRKHAKISFEGNQYFIEDNNSSNGTYVNGIRISKKQPLFDGARIQIAVTSQYPNGAKEYTFRQDKD